MMNYSNFAGRTALVTGGASGLGRAMAEALAATGASVVLFDVNDAQAKHLASDLKTKHSIRAEAVEGSVTNSDDVARGCMRAIELTGRLDIVMNNAGWGIFRPVTERQDLLNLPSWPYAKMAEAWGVIGFRVETVGELRTALVDAGKTPSFVIIEVMVNPDDLSPVTRKYIQASVGKKR